MRLLTLILLFQFSICLGQNLVLNDSAESGGNCALGYFGYFTPSECSDWQSPQQLALYFNACSNSPYYATPANASGFQFPHSGKGYIGISCGRIDNQDTTLEVDGRTYATGELATALLKDSFYCITYYVSLADTAPLAVDRLGVLFSDAPPVPGPIFTPLQYSPQVVSPPGIYFTNKSGWTKISGIYRAQGGEKYLTVGDYNQGSAHIMYKVKPFNRIIENVALYFLDDITVNPLSSNFANINLGNDTTLCDTIGFSKALSVNSRMYDSIVWSTGENSSSIIISHTGIYYVDCYNGDCHVSDTIIISYHNPITTALKQDLIVCADKLPIHLTADTGFSNYAWDDQTFGPVKSVSQSGIYIVSFLTICGTKSDTFNVIKKDSPMPPMVKDTFLCVGDSTIPASVQGIDIKWYSSATDTIYSLRPVILPIPSVGVYDLYVTQTVNGCESSKAQFILDVFATPKIMPSYDEVHCYGSTIQLGETSEHGTKYLWNTQDTTSIISVKSSGYYSLTAVNECGFSSDSFNILIINCDTLCAYAPNAFTPNNDGVNDEYYVYPHCPYINFHLNIFNRWGEKVYDSYDPNLGWDGTYKTQQQPPGCYAYYVTITSESGFTAHAKGSLTLIR